uniref:Uncharacterized protein n=1 Tax=Rhizophora mucronata TaxID=61149 RepID=A0A2P2MY29_RHIMU
MMEEQVHFFLPFFFPHRFMWVKLSPIHLSGEQLSELILSLVTSLQVRQLYMTSF